VENQRNFHAKTRFDSRIYEYLLTFYTLKQSSPITQLQLKEKPASEKDYKIITNNGTLTRYIASTDPTLLSNFTVNGDQFDKFKTAMLMFNGTHNFHNCTITKALMI
jgi:tRNA pseudouridine38-40 synthase